MDKVRIKFVNCYGISRLEDVLEFGEDKENRKINAHLIYAPNGTMKTSFADTIKDIQKERSTVDFYYPDKNTVRELNEILSDGTERELQKDDVLVIDSYDEQYYSDKVNILAHFEPSVRSLRATIPEEQSHRNCHQKHYSTVLLT